MRSSTVLPSQGSPLASNSPIIRPSSSIPTHRTLGVAEQYLDEAQSSLSIEVTDSGEPIDLEVGM